MTKKKKILITVVFLTYLTVLIWFLFFKFNINGLLPANAWNVHRWYSLIPFASFKDHYDPPRMITEFVFNMIGFVPIGLIAAYIDRSKLKYLWAFLLSFGLGMIIEIVQYVSLYGFLDSTDLVCYIIGSMIGVIFGDILQHVLKEKTVDRIVKDITYILIPLSIVAIIMMCVFPPIYPY